MNDIEKNAMSFFNAIDAAKNFANTMPSSRERSLAVTKLDEAHMWFQRAIPPINEHDDDPNTPNKE